MKAKAIIVLAFYYLFNKKQFNYNIISKHIKVSHVYFSNVMKELDLIYCDLFPGSGIIFDYQKKSYVVY